MVQKLQQLLTLHPYDENVSARKITASLPLVESADCKCINLVMWSEAQRTYNFSHLDKLLGSNAGGWTPLVNVGHSLAKGRSNSSA